MSDNRRARGIQSAPFKLVVLASAAILLWQLSTVVLLGFAGILVAVFLRALTNFVGQWTKISQRWSFLVVIVSMSLAAVAACYFGGQAVASQLTELAQQLPASIQNVRENLSHYPWGKWLIETVPESAESFSFSGQQLTGYASGTLSTITGFLATAFIVTFVSLYLAAEPGDYERAAIRLIPVRHRRRAREILTEVHEVLNWWILGKLLAMLLVGISTSIGLALIGVPLAMALGTIAALLTFVPNFGPVISAVPAILLAFADSPIKVVYVIVLYVGIQFVESYLITPLIQQKTVSIRPALTIIAQVAMGILFGVIGIVVATPFTAVALVVIKRLYVEDYLENSSTTEQSAGEEMADKGTAARPSHAKICAVE